MTEREYLEALRVTTASVKSRLTLANEAVQIFPGSADLWCALGNLIQLSDDDTSFDLSQAKGAYSRAIDICSTHTEALEGLGAFLDSVEDDPRAAETYLRRSVDNGGGEHAYALLARVLTQLGRKAEALELLGESRCPFASCEVVQETVREIGEGVWDSP